MLIKVRVYPDANKEEFIKKDANSYEIWVKAKPIQGQANQAVRRVLADSLHLDIKEIRLVKGFKQSNKIFDIKE